MKPINLNGHLIWLVADWENPSFYSLAEATHAPYKRTYNLPQRILH